jgi:hypothetical protein
MRHLVWAALGGIGALGLWFAYSPLGAAALFVAIGAPFVLWRLLGPRGSWLALVVLGVGMAGVLGWQAATGSRCPPEGTTVVLEEDKPPVSCDEIRASAGAMGVFFALLALGGALAPVYARRVLARLPEEEDEDGTDGGPPPPDSGVDGSGSARYAHR